MSIVALLEKQNLIAQKNNLTSRLLSNQSMTRGMAGNYQTMSFGGRFNNLEALNNYETSLGMENITIETNLAMINAELAALNNSKINYMA